MNGTASVDCWRGRSCVASAYCEWGGLSSGEGPLAGERGEDTVPVLRCGPLTGEQQNGRNSTLTKAASLENSEANNFHEISEEVLISQSSTSFCGFGKLISLLINW